MLTEPYAVRALKYDLIFESKKAELGQVKDLILSWTVAWQAMRTRYRTFSDFDLIQRRDYMKDLEEHLQTWYYDKYLVDSTDGLSEEEKDKIEEDWFNWIDIIELVQNSDYFDLLYRFIEQIADVDQEIESIEIVRRKVIIEYGQCSDN